MNPEDLQQIYRAKERRREELSDLPFEEKLKIIGQMQDLGRAMMAARNNLAPERHRFNAWKSSTGDEGTVFVLGSLLTQDSDHPDLETWGTTEADIPVWGWYPYSTDVLDICAEDGRAKEAAL